MPAIFLQIEIVVFQLLAPAWRLRRWFHDGHPYSDSLASSDANSTEHLCFCKQCAYGGKLKRNDVHFYGRWPADRVHGFQPASYQRELYRADFK